MEEGQLVMKSRSNVDQNHTLLMTGRLMEELAAA